MPLVSGPTRFVCDWSTHMRSKVRRASLLLSSQMMPLGQPLGLMARLQSDVLRRRLHLNCTEVPRDVLRECILELRNGIGPKFVLILQGLFLLLYAIQIIRSVLQKGQGDFLQ